MVIPFTTEDFLNVFANYNVAVWPVQNVLFVLAVMAVVMAIRPSQFSARLASLILALLWLWMGVVYHFYFFTRINKAAWAFGTLFIVQALIFIHTGVVKDRLQFRFGLSRECVAGAALIFYALVGYPLLSNFFGHRYPANPTFGLPCPTTIFTLGLLLWAARKTPYVLIIPLAWSLLGFWAALSLSMKEDVGLIVAAILTLLLLLARRRQPALA
jgi:hypothetical protein